MVTLARRSVPNDNSCLFYCVGYLVEGTEPSKAVESAMRQIVADQVRPPLPTGTRSWHQLHSPPAGPRRSWVLVGGRRSGPPLLTLAWLLLLLPHQVLADPDPATRAIFLGKEVGEYAEWIKNTFHWVGPPSAPGFPLPQPDLPCPARRQP